MPEYDRWPPPRREELAPEQLLLYEHDQRELYNPDRRDPAHLSYVSRLREVLRHAVDGSELIALDVGCAQGNFSFGLASRGYRVAAMDLRLPFVQYLGLRVPDDITSRLHPLVASLEHLPFRQQSFDLVLLGEVLEHVAYPDRLLAGVRDLLQPDGMLIATTPNGSRMLTGLPTLSQVRDRGRLLAGQFQPGADGHQFLLSGSELRQLVRATGFEVLAHRFLGSPWVGGHFRIRQVARWLPVGARELLDRLTLQIPVLRDLVSAGQLIVARPANS